jgi:anthranilate phosphoribosyltransferase
MAVVKGDGGEIERNPDMKCLVQSVHEGEMMDEEWPPMFKKRHVKDDTLDIANLIALWRGEIEYEYGTGAVIGTAAITLKMMGKANSIGDAETLAKQMWENRTKEKYSNAA